MKYGPATPETVQALALAYNWALVWWRMQAKALAHMRSLDPRTDEAAIHLWIQRGDRASQRSEQALQRFQLLAYNAPAGLPN